MPITKLRREQLNIGLSDLLWLDRQKVGGVFRTFTAESNETIRFEVSGKSRFDITALGNYEFNFQDNVVFKKYGSVNELRLSYSLGDFVFSAGTNNGIKLSGSKIVLEQDPNGVGLEVLSDGYGTFVKVYNKLGVGVIPTYALDVNGDIRAYGDLLSSKTSPVNIGTLTNQPVKIITNNTPVIYVRGDGSVGIGTTNPQQKLHLSSAGTLAMRLEDTTNSDWEIINSGGNLFIKQIDGDTKKFNIRGGSNIDRFTVDLSSGNVGIGTTTPNYTLDVNGDIRCFGDLLSSKVSTVNIGTLTNQAVQIITNNTARVIIPTTGYIDFKLPVKMSEGIVVDLEKRENIQILNQDTNGYWFEYNSTDHGVNGWGSWDPSQSIGKVYRFMDTGQVIVLLNGQVLTEGSVSNGNITDGDYVFIDAVDSPVENGKALVLAEQPQTSDVVRVIGFFSVYED
jgi:hypothetical protein